MIDITHKELEESNAIEISGIEFVKVVRCKDCTYWDEAKVNSKGFLICPASGMEIFEIDYCSYGERREDGHD